MRWDRIVGGRWTRWSLLRRLAAATVVAGLWLGGGQPVSAAATPLCRFGLNVAASFSASPSTPPSEFYVDDFDLTPLRAGWYVDYRGAVSAPANNGAEYVPIIHTSDTDTSFGYGPTGAELATLVAAYPGATYIVGNEPDRRKVQDDVLPENYAHIFHAARQEILAMDPTARVFAGAIVQPTPLRLVYLDRVLAEYAATYGEAMPVDGWAIHGFLLNERSCDAYNDDLNVCWGADIPPGLDATDGMILTPQDNARLDLFAAGIVRFRTWMAANGYRNTPLYVSEYGVLMPPVFGFPAATVNQYMTDTFDYMLNAMDADIGLSADGNRLVQRFSWFSTLDIRFNGYVYRSTDPDDPLVPPYVLSPMGEHYAAYTAAVAETSDLGVAALAVEGDPPTQVTATVSNWGSRTTPTHANVRFSVGRTLGQSTPLAATYPVALAGCGARTKLVVTWPAGQTIERGDRVWAELLDPDYADADPANDVLSRYVFVNPVRLWLPWVKE